MAGCRSPLSQSLLGVKRASLLRRICPLMTQSGHLRTNSGDLLIARHGLVERALRGCCSKRDGRRPIGRIAVEAEEFVECRL